MQGAYLVQLGTETDDKLSGRVEEVDTGKTMRFQSGDELLQFLEKAVRENTRKKAGQEKD